MTTISFTTRYGGMYFFTEVCPGTGSIYNGYSKHLFSIRVYTGHLWWKRYWKYCLCGDRVPSESPRHHLDDVVLTDLMPCLSVKTFEAGRAIRPWGRKGSWL